MRMRQVESELLSTLGPRHPRVVTLRSELDKRRQQMLAEAARLRASLIGEKKIAEQRLNSIRSPVRGLQPDSDTLPTATTQLRPLQREAHPPTGAFEALLRPH